MSGPELDAPVEELTTYLVDTPSVSGDERALADWVEAGLRSCGHLRVDRDGDAVVARTSLGRPSRVVVAGHLDTVPIADNVPSRRDGDVLYGCGSADMKSGDAVLLRLAATLAEPRHDVTWILYDCEEVEARRNGLGRLAREHRDWLDGDLAVLMEPTDGELEAGCQGTLRVEVTARGTRSHSARSWLGDNAIHRAREVLDRLTAYEPRRPVVEGLEFREGLNAVRIAGGVAGNVIPDECVVTLNYRFAPDRSEEEAAAHVAEVVAPYECVVVDSSPGARPGLDRPLAQEFARVVDRPPRAKYGWTDAARFSALGIPAVNYGPGDPNLAHTRDEHVDLGAVRACEDALRAWLA
jgi:succinyl-diaminopimelate desuccinylase